MGKCFTKDLPHIVPLSSALRNLLGKQLRELGDLLTQHTVEFETCIKIVLNNAWKQLARAEEAVIGARVEELATGAEIDEGGPDMHKLKMGGLVAGRHLVVDEEILHKKKILNKEKVCVDDVAILLDGCGSTLERLGCVMENLVAEFIVSIL